MIELPQVTVIIADTKNYAGAINAIKKTLEQIKPAGVIWFTDRNDLVLDGVEIRKISPFKNKADYSEFIIKSLGLTRIPTTHALIIQHDGYVIDGDMWDDEYLNYDYIGAPWLYPDSDRNVGNGGFSLRSHDLIHALTVDNEIKIVEPEDEVVGRLYRRYLEKKHNIKFAPEELAHKFSYELHEPYGKTFGFHGRFHPPFKPIVVVNRTGAMGDVIQVEPVLHAFWKQGYRVVLKTLPQFYSLFAAHYFPVESFDTLNKALPYKYVDLDMAYEITPKQLHLKSYYDIAGVEGEIRNPKLNFVSTPEIKIFKHPYVVIHIDRRPQPGRNVENIKWFEVTDLLKKKGYLVVQVGKNEHIELDAIQMNTVAEPMLAYLISGCDLFIGVDSGPSHIAVATGRQSIIFFGNVNPDYIHAEIGKKVWPINRHWANKVCDLPYCWHESITTTGQDCVVNIDEPPCANHDTNTLLYAIKEVLK